MISKILSRFVKFPLFKNDKKPIEVLNQQQIDTIKKFNNKIALGSYKLIDNYCLCGNRDKCFDLVVAEKDRYGIAVTNILCKKCGIIRSKKILDETSNQAFYNEEYRVIYSGRVIASKEFFDGQAGRGVAFLKLIESLSLLDQINNVFDYGCGAGGVLFPFLQKGKCVEGCDYGDEYLKYGTEVGMFLWQGDLGDNRLQDESKDLIILSHVMEHFDKPIQVMINLIKKIKPGKFLLVEVPGIFCIKNVYINPILYFQNAHVFNYYYYYLKIFFEQLGLDVLYGNERCTFVLQKPLDWKPVLIDVINDKHFEAWAVKIENYLKKCLVDFFIFLIFFKPIKIILKPIDKIRGFLKIRTRFRQLCKNFKN